MKKYEEFIAVCLVLLCVFGTIAAIFTYESARAKNRNAIDLEARPIATWSKKEIRVKKGELVRIRVINRDCVTHGFAIPELDVAERIISAGHTETVELTPKFAGEYTYMCVVQCDREQHEFMRGKLIVEK
ncbi:MAG: cupredoxin domain-containing protein [Candidatus Latescibacter sp.]|nr:cupredoxin domain-containing protein [Candidatus Latescibacter sp.]